MNAVFVMDGGAMRRSRPGVGAGSASLAGVVGTKPEVAWKPRDSMGFPGVAGRRPRGGNGSRKKMDWASRGERGRQNRPCIKQDPLYCLRIRYATVQEIKIYKQKNWQGVAMSQLGQFGEMYTIWHVKYGLDA
jgi:hypothetical protein